MPTHKKTESERFKGPAKYMEYLFARALITLLQRLPIGLAYKIGRFVGWSAWVLLKRRRLIVRKNLEIVNAWLSEDESRIKDREAFEMPLEEQVREVFQRSGANLFSGFTFNRMSPEKIEKHVQIEGIEHLKSALAAGNGVIVLLAHMGPWEALAQLPSLAKKRGIEAPFGAMYRPLNNAYLDDWYKSQREMQGTRLFSRKDGFHKPVDFIRAGGMLGILSDQKMREGPSAPFFGLVVASTPIPGLLHRRSGAKFLALSIATVGPRLWRLHFASVHLGTQIDIRDRSEMANLCNRMIAESLSVSPFDGFWLHKRF